MRPRDITVGQSIRYKMDSLNLDEVIYIYNVYHNPDITLLVFENLTRSPGIYESIYLYKPDEDHPHFFLEKDVNRFPHTDPDTKSKCKCDIKNLMSIGHDRGCPDRK